MRKTLFTFCSFLLLAHLAGGESISNESTADLRDEPGRSELKAQKWTTQWRNNYGGPLFFRCPAPQYLAIIQSVFSRQHKDRQWRFGCQSSHSLRQKCIWSNYVNLFQQRVEYICPDRYVLTGLSSVYSKQHQDRRWKYQCCQLSRICSSRCYWAPYMNKLGDAGIWRLPRQSYLAGVQNEWNAKFADYRWKFMYCFLVC